MRQGGRILSKVLFTVLQEVKPGISEIAIDQLADSLIRKQGAEPGFKRVKGYKNAICVAVNDIVVHGIPSQRRFAQGDLVCIDCGVFYKGMHTDMAETILVSANDKQEIADRAEKEKFLAVGKKALREAIGVAIAGNRVGHISQIIQRIIEQAGYSVVRNLVGHGVGSQLHEEPEIPGFLDRPLTKTPLLRENMTIAIEVIYAMGKPDVVYAGSDGWAIKTADGSLSAVFERTVRIRQGEPEVLTV
jgi:methionyl aminopeptidase